MVTRKIIKIDEDKCTGCGNCITDCAEGALQIINGKAKLIKDQFCDGLGACIGGCPTGALTIEEREAENFDEEAVKAHLAKSSTVTAPQPPAHPQTSGNCPGARARSGFNTQTAVPASSGVGPAQAIRSELNQWPVQLHLVSPQMEHFQNKELVLLSTCSPIASADIHWRFLRGRAVVIACPKLDRTEGYVEKLAAILSEPSIPKVTVVRMEVPCCGGLTRILKQAAEMSKREDLEIEETIVKITGEVSMPELQ